MPVTDEAFEDVVKLTKQSLSAAEESGGDAVAVDEVMSVLEGPFKGLQGPVLEVDSSSETLTLALTVMGRDTPVELPMRHVVKVVD